MTNSSDSKTVIELFKASFGASPQRVWRAPGRVNLIGEHTDYNGGHVLPCALNLATDLAIAPNGTSHVRLVSDRFNDEVVIFELEKAQSHAREVHWSRYVSAVVAAMQVNGYEVRGCDLAITSTVPDGAGLSSSAALEVVLATALSDLFDLNIDLVSAAKLGQYAENHFVDCQCGIMDQLVSACAIEHHALLIDCATLMTKAVSLPPSHDIFVIHSGVRRGLVDSEYNQRRIECEKAARVLEVEMLCSADLDALERVRAALTDTEFRRARHVISEDIRCRQMAAMLEAGRSDELASLMSASHHSLRDDFEVSLPSIDFLVEILQTALGEEGGARMTGGGFGGCVVAIAPSTFRPTLEEYILPKYHAQTGNEPTLWTVQSADGVGSLETI